MSHKKSALAFLLLLAVLFTALFFRASSVTLDSSVLSLLPSETKTSVSKYILDTYTSRIDRQVIFLIKDNSTFAKAAYSFIEKLKTLPQTKSIISMVSKEDEQEFHRFLFEHKTAFLDPKNREKLESKSYIKWVLASVYSAFMSVSQKELDSDPLLLARSVFSSLAENQAFKISNGILSVKDGENTWYFICLVTKDNGFNLNSADSFVKSINAFCEELKSDFEDSQILMRGTVFYSDYAAKTAEHDLKVLGSISLVGVFILIYLMFRSVLPVFITIVSVFTGVAGGLSLLFILYDTINLMILAMGLSVIGVVCDYSIYYLTMYKNNIRDNAQTVIKRMAKPLLLASGTDIAAYLIILFSPVEPLKQLSVFCIGAITLSVLCVLLLEPYMCPYIKKSAANENRFIKGYLKLISKNGVRNCVLIVTLSVCCYGVLTVKACDDPSYLQTMPYKLKSQDNLIAKLTGQSSAQKFVIISNDSKEALLETSDRVKELLFHLKLQGVIKSFNALPINSLKTQSSDNLLINARLKELKDKLLPLGIDTKTDSYKNTSLSLDEYLNTFTGRYYRQLYISDSQSSTYAVSFILDGVKDRALLEDSLLKISSNICYLDRKDDFTKIFKTFRELIFYVIICFLAVILISGIVRLGLKKGICSFVASLASVLFSLGIMSILNVRINLFNELSLILVLGIGINYTIFFAGNQKTKDTAVKAIFTALLTTLLSVGILIFSSVAAIEGFALGLCSGIISSFILATILPEYFHDKNA